MAKFRTKARAVDMLGRQQIADASTAISELFKNAHDAYADHVEADFFCTDSLLVIRDDGIGMTLEEFETNWLVLGTDSKMLSEEEIEPYCPPGKQERAIWVRRASGALPLPSWDHRFSCSLDLQKTAKAPISSCAISTGGCSNNQF